MHGLRNGESSASTRTSAPRRLTSQLGDVSDDDPSHYFGFVSEIHVEKYVNGEDADEAPGTRARSR